MSDYLYVYMLMSDYLCVYILMKIIYFYYMLKVLKNINNCIFVCMIPFLELKNN